ncbi:MAG: TonB-dependent receptor [Flavobacteriaceae bacterium]|nr:TonB-dependent receptor [Flavobacteriaceae bacterium]
MNLKVYTQIILSLITINFAYGQDYYKGLVVDEITQLPLPDAFVESIDQKDVYGITDKNGKFQILATSSKAQFSVQYFGYETKIIELNKNEEAQIILTPTENQLEEILLTSTKNPLERGIKSLSQITINQEVLQKNSSARLGDVLSRIDGVTFISTGQNVQLPVIHGLYGNRILILNNGFKHGFQNWGSDHAPEIDVSGAEMVRVVKGASSVKYGPDALGGAVVIENNSLALNRGFYGRTTTSYQTNGRGYGLNTSFGEGKENFSYHIGGNFNQIGDRRAPGYNLTNTGARDYALQGGLRYDYKDWTFKANYSLVNQTLGILRASVGSSGPALIRNMEAPRPTFIKPFSYKINEPNQEIQHQLASLKATRLFDNGNRLKINYARQWNARKEFDVRRNANLPVLDLELTTDDLQIEFEHELTDKISGSVGVQYFSQSNSNNPGTGVTPFIPNYETERYSIYLLETLALDASSWELGLRYDFEDNGVGGRDNRNNIFQDSFTFSNVTASLGNIWKFNKQTTWRNNIGTGWRPPNMAELFSFGQHESQTTFGLLRYQPSEENVITANEVTRFKDSNVAPENSIKYTTEIEWTSEKNRLSATAYTNYIRNFIFSRPIGVLGTARGPMPTFIIDQADALFIGSDLTFTHSYSQQGKASIGGSYIWSRNVERGEDLIHQPPIHLHASIDHSFTDLKWVDELDFSISPTYTFRQFQAPRTLSVRSLVEGTADLNFNDPIFDFMDPPSSYFLLNASVGVQKDKFYLSVEARNLLNTNYRDYLNNMRYFADEMGVNFIFSLTYTL